MDCATARSLWSNHFDNELPLAQRAEVDDTCSNARIAGLNGQFGQLGDMLRRQQSVLLPSELWPESSGSSTLRVLESESIGRESDIADRACGRCRFDARSWPDLLADEPHVVEAGSDRRRLGSRPFDGTCPFRDGGRYAGPDREFRESSGRRNRVALAEIRWADVAD